MEERFTTRLAVFVIIRDADGKMLMQQRANTGYLDGYWDFPSGHVERDEALIDAAARELLEEVGVEVRTNDLELVNIDQYFNDQNYVNFTFLAKKWQGEPRVCESEKCSAVAWFAPDELPDKCVNVVRANQRSGFSQQLDFTVTTKADYQRIVSA